MAKRRGACLLSLVLIGVGALLVSCGPAVSKPSQSELASFLAKCHNTGIPMKGCMNEAKARYDLTDRELFDILAPPK
jgi:hypothetical protein